MFLFFKNCPEVDKKAGLSKADSAFNLLIKKRFGIVIPSHIKKKCAPKEVL